MKITNNILPNLEKCILLKRIGNTVDKFYLKIDFF
jgi:hypothetical protein